jgi:uncharacterized protein (TIGR03083 family)
VEYGDYLRQLDEDICELLASMVGVELATRVSACPGWSLGDLAFHLAEGYQHKVQILRTGIRPDPWPPASPPRAWRAPVLEFLQTSAADLLSELRRRESDQRCWTWYPENQTVGFWARRMAHETVVHRWDAEDCFQQPTPIGAAVAADAIDELLVVFLSGDWSDDPQPAPFGNVDVVSGLVRWRVSLTAESVDVLRSPLSIGNEPMANAQMEGPEQTLLLALWGRSTRPPLVAGDAALIKGLLDRLLLVTN